MISRSHRVTERHENELATSVVERKVMVELRCVKKADFAHKTQVLVYCRLTGMKLGCLLNFGEALT